MVSSDICNENVQKMMPAELNNILCLLITGKSEDFLDENNSQHVNIFAVAQDIIYMTSIKQALQNTETCCSCYCHKTLDRK